MWDAVSGGLQPQPWHPNIIWAPPFPNFQKFDPYLHRYNSVRVHPYAHPQHIMALKHFIYTQIYVTWPIPHSDTFYSSVQDPVQGQSLVNPSQSLVKSLMPKNADFGGFIGKEGVIFFQRNFTGIILTYFEVKWDTQNWSRGYLKKWHFFLWTPYLFPKNYLIVRAGRAKYHPR